MKKIILSGLICLSLNSFADYVVIIDKEDNNYEIQKIVSTKNGEWSNWSDTGVYYDCTLWLPDPLNINYGTDFIQNRNCKQDQIRSRNIYDVWLDGSETINRLETENKTTIEEEIQQAVGFKNYIDSTKNDPWTKWTDVGIHYDCSVWNPSVENINKGDDFTQSRECNQDQNRTRNIYDVWLDGEETFNRVETENKTIIEIEEQAAIGTKNYIVSTSSTTGSWLNKGTAFNCSVWTPDASTIRLNENFNQSRSCKQEQYQTITTTNTWVEGNTTQTINENVRTIDIIENQNALGSKPNMYSFKELPKYGVVEFYDGVVWQQVENNKNYPESYNFRYNPTETEVLAVSRDINIGSFDEDLSTPYYAEGNHSISDWGTVSGDTAVFIENGVTVTTRVTAGDLAFANSPGTAIGVGLGTSLSASNELGSMANLEITLDGEFLNDVKITADGLGGCYDYGTTCETKVIIDAYDHSNLKIGTQGGFRDSTSPEYGEAYIDDYYFVGKTAIKKFVISIKGTNEGGNNPDLGGGQNTILNMTISKSAFETIKYKLTNVNNEIENKEIRLNINESNANTNVLLDRELN